MFREITATLTAVAALTPVSSEAHEPPSAQTPPPPFDETIPDRDPAVAMSIAPSVGFGVLLPSSPLDETLSEAGRTEIGTLTAATLGARYGLHAYGFALSFSGGTFLSGNEDDSHETSLARDWLVGELSYDVLEERWLTLGPVLGAGASVTRLCVSGQPAGTPPSQELFRQVLEAPGASTCLETIQPSARLGLVGGLAAPVAPELTLSFDLRPSVSWALGGGDYEILEAEGLPTFSGPEPPRTAFSVMLEIGFVFGFGER